MIVKNEEHIIERGLRSCLSQMDTFCIVDTGSTDKTKEIIQKVSDELGVKGYIYDRPWVNFGHNRSEALELARKHMTWAFMLDADDILEGIIDRELLKEDIGGFDINMIQTNIIFNIRFLVNLKYDWKFIGVTHEYPHCTNNSNISKLPDSVSIKYTCEGQRNMNKQKFFNDIELLEKDLNTTYNKERRLFYLAQSYRDAGIKDKAIQYYLQRAESKGWVEEIYMSYYNLINLSDNLDDKLKYAWKAQECVPQRKDAVYEILKYARINANYNYQIYSLGLLFRNNLINTNHLFLDTNAYGWMYDDEFGLQAYYTKNYAIALESFLKSYNECPEYAEDRLISNIKFCVSNLPPMPQIEEKEEVLEEFDTDLLEFEQLQIYNNEEIPRIIHQIWIGPKPIPEKSVEYIKKIKELHPDYQYRLWINDDLTPENFVNYKIIQKCYSWTQKSDLMRYEILYQYGGIYLDIDFEIFKNLEPLLTNELVVCNEDNKINDYMSTAFIASKQYNKNILNCVNNFKYVDLSLSPNASTGPYYFRKNIRLDDTVEILPTHTMYPTHWTMKGYYPYKYLEDTYGVHHWHGDWSGDGIHHPQ